MENNLSRRGFVKGAGLAAGAAALSGAALANADEAPAQDWLPEAWDYECDLLVIGYGGAGMWASLIGADECAQQVLILEKAPVEGGGNSRINNGEWTIIPEDKKEVFKEYLVTFSKGAIPEDMANAWVEECARNTEYADKYGMTYNIVDEALAGSIPEYYKLDEAKFAGCQRLSQVEGFGMRSFHELDAKREELGAEILFDCHDESLIQNPQTREIVGCYTLIGDDPEPKAVKARKGVIMTCGGFEFNEELKNKYLKIYPFKFEGWRFNTGDGIRMVQEVGANLWHMDNVISMTSMYTRDPENDFSILAFPGGNSFIWVNRLGKRFVNENNTGSPHNGWHTLMSFSDQICDFDRIPTWCVFDQATFEGGKMGTSQGDFFECGNFASDLPDELRDWDGWSEDNQAEVDKGWIDEGRHPGRACRPDEGLGLLDGRRDPQGHRRRVQRLLRAGPRRALRPPAPDPGRPERRGPLLRLRHLPRQLLDPGRPREERQRPGARPRRQPDPASLRGRLLWQLPGPQLRHHRRQQRREPGVGPHLRPPRRLARELGRVNAQGKRVRQTRTRNDAMRVRPREAWQPPGAACAYLGGPWTRPRFSRPFRGFEGSPWTELRLSRPIPSPHAPRSGRDSPSTCGSLMQTSNRAAEPVKKVAILSKELHEKSQSVEKAAVLSIALKQPGRRTRQMGDRLTPAPGPKARAPPAASARPASCRGCAYGYANAL